MTPNDEDMGILSDAHTGDNSSEDDDLSLIDHGQRGYGAIVQGRIRVASLHPSFLDYDEKKLALNPKP